MSFVLSSTGDGKRALIENRDAELYIEVDTDDVGPEIEATIKKMVWLLNKHWDDDKKLKEEMERRAKQCHVMLKHSRLGSNIYCELEKDHEGGHWSKERFR